MYAMYEKVEDTKRGNKQPQIEGLTIQWSTKLYTEI